MLPWIQQRKADYPFWGYRRICAYLLYVERLPMDKKRLLRVMRENSLLVTLCLRLSAKQTPASSKLRPTKPNKWWAST